MATLSKKYADLKQKVGGNREHMGFESTFGMPMEEERHITPPGKYIRRILAEIEFAIRLSAENENKFDSYIDEALDLLGAVMEEEGVLTKTACLKAEEILMPLSDASKEYKVILAGHAHIDMNWMWSWHETVATTLATFRTMLNIMDEYPEFCFSQSQASVYRIVEEFDPEMMERIKARITEGRWEITASAWVETDKNMPNTESLLRHIKYTKNYLRDNWGIDPAKLEVDFSPDTFGHSANLPEIDSLGDVKYYYHCRGVNTDNALYRWKGSSGKEMLAYFEQFWYNSGITPQIGLGIIDISKRCAGFKTGLIVYGVGDHGGGPTRRDVERGIEMMEWPIFPTVKFGTFHEFFHEAESIREKLPVIDHELNFIFQGCYTTQSRIKMGNRMCERALTAAEAMNALATAKTNAGFCPALYQKAWQDVLFTHFHDILTGSCVQDSREHAMGLYSNSLAVAQTQFSNAMLRVSEAIDTSSVICDDDISSSQSEGGGVGYGVEGFVSGMPRCECGNGKTRIFNIFNPTMADKKELVEITVWDWTGDMRRIEITDIDGNPLEFQMIDGGLQQYWNHKFFRVLVYADVAAYGYTTAVLREKEFSGDYPVYLNPRNRVDGESANIILENDFIRAEFSYKTGLLISMKDKATGREYIKQGEGAGLRFVTTTRPGNSAWAIGNYITSKPVEVPTRCSLEINGPLKKGFYAEYRVERSNVKVHVSLSKNSPALEYRCEVDWHEVGGATIPVLTYEVPLATAADNFLYDIPAGSIVRGPIDGDVPALQYALALTDDKLNIGIVNESKYGYRATKEGKLITTFINTAVNPDPYPERGIHKINFHVGLFAPCPKIMEETATSLNNKLAYQPTGSHKGTLPAAGALLNFESDESVVSAVAYEDGKPIVRVYNTTANESVCKLAFDAPIKSACAVDLFGAELEAIKVADGKAEFAIPAFGIKNIKLDV